MKAEVASLTAHSLKMEKRIEDAEGRSRHNNLRFVGFPERAIGPSVKLFLEGWITYTLKSKRLSNFLTTEHAHRS